jgi:hydroxyproline transport system ATP-binding protein
MTMILVIHEMSFARDVSDMVAFFHQGVMEEVGPAKEVMTSSKSAHLQKFLSNVR